MDTNDTNKPLTVMEVAELWRVSKDVVYDELVHGNLKGFKVGYHWRIRPEDVREYENQSIAIRQKKKEERELKLQKEQNRPIVTKLKFK